MVQGGQPIDDQTVWTVKDGVLVCSGGPRGYLRTKETFADYALSFQWRTPTNTSDSGVGLMMAGPDQPDPSCLEVQIHNANSGDFYIIGGFYAEAGGQKIPSAPTSFNPATRSRRASGTPWKSWLPPARSR